MVKQKSTSKLLNGNKRKKYTDSSSYSSLSSSGGNSEEDIRQLRSRFDKIHNTMYKMNSSDTDSSQGTASSLHSSEDEVNHISSDSSSETSVSDVKSVTSKVNNRKGSGFSKSISTNKEKGSERKNEKGKALSSSNNKKMIDSLSVKVSSKTQCDASVTFEDSDDEINRNQDSAKPEKLENVIKSADSKQSMDEEEVKKETSANNKKNKSGCKKDESEEKVDSLKQSGNEEEDSHKQRGSEEEEDSHKQRRNEEKEDLFKQKGNEEEEDPHKQRGNEEEEDSHKQRRNEEEEDSHKQRGCEEEEDSQKQRGSEEDSHKQRGSEEEEDSHKQRRNEEEEDSRKQRGSEEEDSHKQRGSEEKEDSLKKRRNSDANSVNEEQNRSLRKFRKNRRNSPGEDGNETFNTNDDTENLENENEEEEQTDEINDKGDGIKLEDTKDETEENEKGNDKKKAEKSLSSNRKSLERNSNNNVSCITISDSSDEENKNERPVYLTLRKDLFYSNNQSKPESSKSTECSKSITEIQEISSDSDVEEIKSVKPQSNEEKVDKEQSSDSDDFVKVTKKKGKSRKNLQRFKGKKKNNIIDSDSESSQGKGKENSSSDNYKVDSSDPEQDSSNSEDKKKKKSKKNKKVDSESDESVKQIHSSSSDSESEDNNKKRKTLRKRKRQSSKSEETSSSDPDIRKNKKRKRIKQIKGSSSSSDEESADHNTRKHIRKVWANDTLQESTIAAEKAEKERKARIAERQQKYNQIFDAEKLQKGIVEKVVLDFDEKTNRELLCVDATLAKKLKPHQANGVKFMWESCFESLKRIKKDKGSGCILAHCMGLGKTLQIITLVHTLLANSEKTGVSKVLIVGPLNTVLNWVDEFRKWLEDIDGEIDIYEMAKVKSNVDRQCVVRNWSESGGVLIIGYNMFRNLTAANNRRISKKLRDIYLSAFLDPGPDLVVCDEGHLLKNEKTNLSIAMNKIKTPKRIVLTGTPMQNNLREYYCMVQFVKPDLLGTYKEYLNRFVNPITNGQYTDSTPHDIATMKRRSHVLHSLLDGVIQRKDYAVLAPFLPPKYEYVLFIQLSELQISLYKYYIQNKSLFVKNRGQTSGAFLFGDFQELQRVCTHPRVLLDKSIEDRNKRDFLEDEEDSEGSLKDFIDDSEDTSNSTDSESNKKSKKKRVDSDDNQSSKEPTKRITRGAVTSGAAALSDDEVQSDPFTTEWWHHLVDQKELDNIELGSKLYLLFTVIQQCEQIGDKLLVFSQSLYSLNIIEYFLNKIDEATQNGTEKNTCGFFGSWSLGLDYFRIDGSSSCDNRQTWCNNFNNPDNTRARLFLISTKAGGLGINLVAANRVIIFDVSWNPSHDVQSIYRVYRFGQTKPCYIYRFVCQGTMEMKVYERQVTKQAISKRVVDEQQIDRHYTQNDLMELYKCEPNPSSERPTPLVPKDILLGELLQSHAKIIYRYHEHQSLLENKEDEELNEEERKAAWEEFENEKTLRKTQSVSQIPPSNLLFGVGLLIKKDNPTWGDQEVQRLVPAFMQQLNEQLVSGNNFLYMRVVDELRNYQLKQQQQRYLQQMYMQQALQNNGAAWAQQLSSMMRFPTPNVRRSTSDVIELND